MLLTKETALFQKNAITSGISNKANSSDAIARTQQIYYRSNSNIKPTVYPTVWITREDNQWNNGYNITGGWSRKVTPISNGTGADVDKYLFLWTATQKQKVNGDIIVLTADDIALDESTTVIDGGKIITGSITANEIAANSITSDQLNVSELNISQILTLGALTSEDKAIIDGKASASEVAILNSAISIDPTNQLSRFGYLDGFHILIDSNENSSNKGISFWYGSETEPSNKTAFIDGKYLTIPYTVVLNAMDVGAVTGQRWRWEHNERTHHLTLKWIEGGI